MSNLPGFTKVGVTKLKDLEMEDTFLQNLQVMNGGEKIFDMKDSTFNFSLYYNNGNISVMDIGCTTTIPQESNPGPGIYILNGTPSADQYSMMLHGKELYYDTTSFGRKSRVKLSSQDIKKEEEYQQQIQEKKYATIDQVGITNASEMNQSEFWDTDIIVPTGHTLTNTDGIPASQITSGELRSEIIPSITTSKISDMSSTLENYVTNTSLDTTLSGYASLDNDQKISSEVIPNLDAGIISTGTFSTSRIPNLSASKIASGTLNVDRIPDLSSTYAKLDSNNKVNSSVIPDLSSTYAPLTNGRIENIPYYYNNNSLTTLEINSFTDSVDVMHITSLFPQYNGLFTRYYGYGFQVTNDNNSSVYFESGTVTNPDNARILLEDTKNSKSYLIKPSGVTQT